MSPKFKALLDSAYSEITRRDPGYLTRFPIDLPSPRVAAARYVDHPLAASLGRAEIEKALAAGLAHFAAASPGFCEKPAGSDPIASFLCDSIVDSLRAERGLLALEPSPIKRWSLSTLLSRAYVQRRINGDARYFVRREGTHPLLVITAMGTPGQIWRQLLADGLHPFQILIAENQTGGLFGGGYRRYADIAAETDAIAAILDFEGIRRIDLVAWCNGARVALDLACRYPKRVSALVLVAPQLCGNLLGVPADPSPFERDLRVVLNEVTNRPHIAPFFAAAISGKVKQPPDWDRLGADPLGRAAAFFGLPASDQSDVLVAPFSNAATLTMLAQRVASDEAYPTHEALAAVTAPMMILLGEHDQVVNNAFIFSAVKRWAPAAIIAVIGAGGHYIQDLQYPYFSQALGDFLQHHRPPVGSARLVVTAAES